MGATYFTLGPGQHPSLVQGPTGDLCIRSPDGARVTVMSGPEMTDGAFQGLSGTVATDGAWDTATGSAPGMEPGLRPVC